MASKSLFPKQERGDSLSGVFETTSRLNDSRLAADTVEVMGWFNTDNEQILGHVRGHSNNRVLANLLVVQAGEKFGKAEAHLSKSLLATDHPTYVASGLFALTEIVRRQATLDLVKFQTNLLLQDEINGALGFCASGNKMVVAQAQRLAVIVISFSAGVRSA